MSCQEKSAADSTATAKLYDRNIWEYYFSPVTFFAAGMLATVCSTIKECLDSLPGGERTLVGFLTFDAHLHFYNIKSSLTQPQMMVVLSSLLSPHPIWHISDTLNLLLWRSLCCFGIRSVPQAFGKIDAEF